MPGCGGVPQESSPYRHRLLKCQTVVRILSQLSTLLWVVKDSPFQPHNWHSLSLLMAQAIRQRETEQEAAGRSVCIQLSPLNGLPPH